MKSIKPTIEDFYYDLLVIAGALLLVIGIALISVPVALIVGGLVIMAGGLVGALLRGRSRAQEGGGNG